jgi:CRP-like cAMP-binding protein
LVRIANERGGEDNISAIVIEVAPDVPANTDDTMRQARITQNLRALGGIELFGELSFSEVLEVAGALKTAEFERGDEILGEGDASQSLYIIADGRVEVQRGEKRLAVLGAGSHFGEMALLTNRPRSATVRATEPCRVLVLTREQLYPLFQNNPVIAVKFLWNLSVRQSLRLDEASEWLSTGAERAPDTVIDRVAASPFSKRDE